MTTALVLMDLQRNIVARYPAETVLAAARRAADAARAAGVPVVFVRVAFRDGAPEIAPTNRQFARLRGAATGGEHSEATQIDDALAPRPDEPVVVKRRVGAFAGSDLAEVLRGFGATRLVLAGIATSGVVLSTVRLAADLDFDLVVLEDACVDGDPDVHRVLMERVFPKQAEVTTVDAWAATLPQQQG